MICFPGGSGLKPGISGLQAGLPSFARLCLLLCVLIILCLVIAGPVAAKNTVEVEWENNWNGRDMLLGLSSAQTSDGGFILTGEIIVQNYFFQRNSSQIILARLDGNGSGMWQKTISLNGESRGTSVQQTSDGGFIVVGTTENQFYDDKQVCLVKTDASGQLMWKKSYGAGGDDLGVNVRQTGDGGYIIAADSQRGSERSKMLLIKTGAAGEAQWMKYFGGNGDKHAASVILTDDGGFVLAGRVYSDSTGGYDVCLLKTGPRGNVEWEKSFGGKGWDIPASVEQTSDGGYIVTGHTYSYGGGESDVYLLKTGPKGDLEWERFFGGRDLEVGRNVRQTGDGGYLVAGWSNSFGDGKISFYLLEISPSGKKIQESVLTGDRYEQDFFIGRTSDGEYTITGWRDYTLPGFQVRNEIYLSRLRLIK
ncbi:MAG: hypothetical protein ACOY46_14505 [Bacillota bacterium]